MEWASLVAVEESETTDAVDDFLRPYDRDSRGFLDNEDVTDDGGGI